MLNRRRVNDVFPVCSLEIGKPGLFRDADAVVEAILRRIEEHPKARLISVFDQLEYVWETGGEIAPEISAVRQVIFCLGRKLPAPDDVALRPKSIGVTELKDRFVVNFLESTADESNETLARWLESLMEEQQ